MRRFRRWFGGSKGEERAGDDRDGDGDGPDEHRITLLSAQPVAAPAQDPELVAPMAQICGEYDPKFMCEDVFGTPQEGNTSRKKPGQWKVQEPLAQLPICVWLDSWCRQVRVAPTFARDGARVPEEGEVCLCAGTNAGSFYGLTKTGRIAYRTHFDGGVQSMTIPWAHPDADKVMAIGLKQGPVLWMDVASGKVVRHLGRHYGFVGGIAQANERYFLSGANANPCILLTDTVARDGKGIVGQVNRKIRGGCVWSMVAVPPSYVYLGGDELMVMDVTMSSVSVVHTSKDHTGTLRDLCTTDHGLVASAGWDSKVGLFDPKPNADGVQHRLVHMWSTNTKMNCVQSSRDILAAGGDSEVVLFSLLTLDVLSTIGASSTCWSIAFLGSHMWISTFDGEVTAFEGLTEFTEWSCMLPRILSLLYARKMGAPELVSAPMDVIRLLVEWIRCPPYPERVQNG